MTTGTFFSHFNPTEPESSLNIASLSMPSHTEGIVMKQFSNTSDSRDITNASKNYAQNTNSKIHRNNHQLSETILKS